MLALICAGLTVPLASVLLSKASNFDPIEESINEVLLAEGLAEGGRYKLISAKLKRDNTSGSWVEIHLEGPSFPPKEIAEKWRSAVKERHGEGVKTKIRMTLIEELTP